MKYKDIIIFDIDRTIYDGSIGQDFILELINENVISPKILANLSFEMLEYELDIQNYSKTVNDALKILSNELKGKEISKIKNIAKRVVQYNHYKFYDFIFELPKLYKNFEYVILSLEPQILVSEISEYLKIPNFVCNEFIEKKEILLGNDKIYTDKITLLNNSQFIDRNIIAAFGDSENDLPILNLAKLKMVINPTENLNKKIYKNTDFHISNPKLVSEDFKKYILKFI
jgi:phosphoserine phosphatase